MNAEYNKSNTLTHPSGCLKLVCIGSLLQHFRPTLYGTQLELVVHVVHLMLACM
jgi:hypothetical protein